MCVSLHGAPALPASGAQRCGPGLLAFFTSGVHPLWNPVCHLRNGGNSPCLVTPRGPELQAPTLPQSISPLRAKSVLSEAEAPSPGGHVKPNTARLPPSRHARPAPLPVAPQGPRACLPTTVLVVISTTFPPAPANPDALGSTLPGVPLSMAVLPLPRKRHLSLRPTSKATGRGLLHPPAPLTPHPSLLSVPLEACFLMYMSPISPNLYRSICRFVLLFSKDSIPGWKAGTIFHLSIPGSTDNK